MALTAAELRVIVEAVGTKDAQAALQQTGKAVDQTADKSKKAGAASQAAGKAFVAGMAGAGAAFTVAVQNASEFSQQLSTINTVARLNESQTTAMGDAIQQMSRDTGMSTDDLTAAMYDLVSAGTVTSDDLKNNLAGSMEVVKHASDLAIGGLGTTSQTVDLLTSALNAYGLDASHAADVTDMFAVAIERGKVTAAEIGDSLSNVAPIAASAGISLEEISATYATLTANGVPAAEATTQMRAAITALLSPNEKLKDIMADTGVNFAQVAKDKGLQVALQELRDITDKTGQAVQEVSGAKTLGAFQKALKANQKQLGLTNSEMEGLLKVAGKDGVSAAMAELNKEVSAGDAGLSDALGRVEGYNFLLQTTGENATTFGDNLAAAMDSAGTASEQAEIAMKGPVEQAKRLAANIITFTQDVGGPFAQSVGPILLMFNQLAPAMGGLIRPATALGGAIGGLAGKGILMAGSFTGKMVPAILSASGSMLRFAGTAIAQGLTAIGTFIIRLAAAGAAAVAFGAKLIAQGAMAVIRFAATMIAQGLVAIGQFIVRMAIATGTAIAGFVTALVTTAIPALIGFAGTIFTTAIPAVVALLAPFLPIIAIVGTVVAVVAGLFLAWQNNFLGIRDIAANVWNAITGLISGAINLITGIVRGFLDFIGHIWDGITGAAGAAWDGVTGVISGAVDGITGIIGGIVDVARGVWDTVSGIFGAIGDAAKGVGDFVGGVGDAAFGWIPSFESGTLDTGQGGLAMLHPHEMVVPKDMAQAIRGAIKGTPQQNPAQQDNRQFTVVIQGSPRGVTAQNATDQLRRVAAMI